MVLFDLHVMHSQSNLDASALSCTAPGYIARPSEYFHQIIESLFTIYLYVVFVKNNERGDSTKFMILC